MNDRKFIFVLEKAVVLLLVGVCFLLTACGKRIDYDIQDDSIAVDCMNSNQYEYVNPSDPEDKYQGVEIDGRRYVIYGTVKSGVNGEQIGKCIAFEKQDNNMRYYDVSETDDFIAEYYVNNIMMQMVFLRDLDTLGENITVPDFIESYDYDIWK